MRGIRVLGVCVVLHPHRVCGTCPRFDPRPQQVLEVGGALPVRRLIGGGVSKAAAHRVRPSYVTPKVVFVLAITVIPTCYPIRIDMSVTLTSTLT